MPPKQSKKQKTLLLIDGNSLVHRLYHALPPLTASDGRPIQAIYGLANIILKLFREDKPDYAAACFDRPEPTYRDKLYKDYKGQRPPTPDELINQLKEAHKLLPLYGIRTFEAPGYEADDLIATLAEKFKDGKNTRVVILTGDLDTLQLVESDHVVIRTFRKGLSDTFIYNEAAVKERFDLPPSNMVDYKALVGDPSDNIKGVPGVGPKTATELIKTYGSVEGIYKNIAKDEKLSKKFGQFKEVAALSKKLVTLDRKAPVDAADIESLAVREDTEKLVAYLHSLGFSKIIERISGGEEKITALPAQKEPQGLLFGVSTIAPALPTKAPSGEFTEYILVSAETLSNLKSSALASKKPKVGFDLKTSLKKLRAEGRDLAGPYFDLGVAYWLLDSDQRSYDPEFVFRKFLRADWRGTEDDLSRAHAHAEEALKKYALEKVFYEIEMPLLPILADMELRGIGVSRKALAALRKELGDHLRKLTAEIYKKAGGEFNLNSPKQLGEVLFGKLGLGTKKKTRGGQLSTNAETLELLRGTHPVVPLILNYREDFKIMSTYAEPISTLMDKEGRLHTEFVQTGTATGRLSSRAPNLQNIPQESIWAPALRKAFAAQPGFSFLAFDYSQLELRIMASASGDPLMKNAFKKGVDIHALTASKVLKKPLFEIAKNDRRLAKTLNFGLIYGMGKSAFARAAGIGMQEAGQFIENYFREFAGVREWQEKTKAEARTYGYLTTPTGRRRVFPGFQSGVPYIRAEMERAAINFPIQSLASDMIKIAMIRCEALLHERGLLDRVRLLLSIHDELLFEVRDDTMGEVVPMISDIMEQVYPLKVPLEINVSRGTTWGNLLPVSANGHSLSQKNSSERS